MKNRLELTILVIVIVTIIVGTTTVTIFAKLQCDEKGGVWTRMIDGGCRMESKECKISGGISIDCLQNRVVFHGGL